MKQKTQDWSDDFITRLEYLLQIKNRGALAQLRREVKRDVSYEVFRWLPPNTNIWQENAAIIIGPLFAYYYQAKEESILNFEGNLGASFRSLVSTLVKEGSKEEDARKRVERRFLVILNSHIEDIPHHLRYAVGILRSKDIPINWRRLTNDILNWTHDDKFVQRNWSRSFWGFPKEAKKYQETEEDINEVTKVD